MDPVAQAEAAVRLQKLRRLKQLRESNGLSFYRPHPKQDAFHRAANYRFRYVRTGNRFGKSELGTAEDLSFCLGYRPWIPESDPARYEGIPKKPVKGVVICQDWEKADEIFTNREDGLNRGKVFKFMPKDAFVGTEKNHSGNTEKIIIRSKWGGMSTLWFDTIKSFKSNPQGHESSAWDFVHVDEPCPEQMWKAYYRGLLDAYGKAWFTCTPLCEPWINDFFLASRRDSTVLDKPLVSEERSRWMITGSSRDNPYLSEAAIAEYERDLTHDEVQCRINGIPLAMSGLVYKNFRWDRHVYRKTPIGWDTPNRPPKDYTIRYAIDPHPKTPHAVLFCATSPLGQSFFFFEIFKQVFVGELCDMIKDVVRGYNVEQVVIDPIVYTPNPINGQTMAMEFVDNGITFGKAPKDPYNGIQLVTQELDKPDNLYFWEGLTETLFEFDHYIWDMNRDNKVEDKNDHMMENLYRLVMSDLSYINPVAQNVIIPMTVVDGAYFDLPTYVSA